MNQKELEAILSKMVILIDTREQQIKHITAYFDKKGIKYTRQKLDCGDYSFKVDERSYENEIVVERKNSLEELSGNFTTQRERFEREFQRCKGKIILLVENGSIDKILEHKYRSELSVNAFLGSLQTFENRYDINTKFVSYVSAGKIIYSTFIYFLREQMKGVSR